MATNRRKAQVRHGVVHLSTVHKLRDIRIRRKECATLVGAGYAVTMIARLDEYGHPLADGVDSVALPTRSGGRAGRFVFGLVDALGSVMKVKPALVHIHDPELLVLLPVLRVLGFWCVYDVHEDLPAQIRTKGWIPPTARALVSAIAARVEPFLARSAHGVVVVEQDWIARYAAPHAAVVKNYPERLALGAAPKDTPPRFAYAGGVEKVRGCTAVVAAATSLVSTVDLRVTLAGPAHPVGYADELSGLDEHGVIDIVGWLDAEGLGNLYSRAIAGFVLLAPQPNYLDAVASKIYEYMHAGLPMILSDLPSHRRIVEEWNCGLIVPHNDVAAIADAMRRIIEDETLRAELVAGSRSAAAAGFEWETEGHKLLQLYRDIGVLPNVA